MNGFFEGFRDIAKLKAAMKTAQKKAIPIIIIKMGRSSRGVSLASSHAGTLAGDVAIIDSALRQLSSSHRAALHRLQGALSLHKLSEAYEEYERLKAHPAFFKKRPFSMYCFQNGS
jgi:acyl-CoA synthetase (NDP forming)